MRELALLLCVHLVVAIEFFQVGTQSQKRADPCNLLLYRPTTRPTSLVDCRSNQLPSNAVTMLVPTDIESLGWGVSAALYPYTAAYMTARPVTMTLQVDEPPFTTATVNLRLSTPEGKCGFTDPNTQVVGTVAGRTVTFNVPLGWRTLNLELAGTPRSICVDYINEGIFTYTGVKIRVVTGCNTDSLCTSATSAAQPFQYRTILNDTLLARKIARTKCCPNSLSFAGECINPSAESCCNGISYSPSTTKCCRETTEMIQWNEAPCPCWRSTSTSDCALLQETCCLPTKYSELNTDATRKGECYNTTTYKCCETGHIYQPGVEQCCVINGLQSVDVPCPCEQDTHCKASGLTTAEQGNFICCKQTSPPLYESKFNTTPSTVVGSTIAACSTYSEFPIGFGPAQSTRCPGVCINSQYQVCCNGVACVDKFERCCNATCCNKFLSACVKSRRSGSVGQWFNDNDFNAIFDVCSTIEQMETVKAFWVFVWPALLMLLTFLGLALTLGYASHANRHAIVEYMWIERFMILLGILSSLFSIPLFFAPLYKYGTLVVIISLFAIVTAASRVRWLNLASIALQGVLLIYLFDPFHGNAYFNLAMDRTPTGATEMWSMGVLHSTWRMWPSLSDAQNIAFCTNYFNFFKFDMNARDTERYENPLVPTFGYCSRGYVEALYLFEGGILVTVLLQFLVNLVAVVWRFKDYLTDPLYLEIHGKQL